MNSLAEYAQEQIQVVDAVEEMRMRSWARRHYTWEIERRNDFHPIVVDEMRHRDQELEFQNSQTE